jgi:toxin YoeB
MKMNKNWSDEAWEDYEYWQNENRKTVSKINKLLKSVERDGVSNGEGKPEFLKYLKLWSRRITDEHRLVYDVVDDILYIYACKGHYED